MKRRLFLFAAPAIVAADSLMKISPPPLILWGDGVHDDSEALNAFFRGKKIDNRGEGFVGVVDGHAVVHGGKYMLGQPMITYDGRFESVTITYNSFDTLPGMSEPIFYWSPS